MFPPLSSTSPVKMIGVMSSGDERERREKIYIWEPETVRCDWTVEEESGAAGCVGNWSARVDVIVSRGFRFPFCVDCHWRPDTDHLRWWPLKLMTSSLFFPKIIVVAHDTFLTRSQPPNSTALFRVSLSGWPDNN